MNRIITLEVNKFRSNTKFEIEYILWRNVYKNGELKNNNDINIRIKHWKSFGSGGIAPESIKYGSNKFDRIIKTIFWKGINGENIPR